MESDLLRAFGCVERRLSSSEVWEFDRAWLLSLEQCSPEADLEGLAVAGRAGKLVGVISS